MGEEEEEGEEEGEEEEEEEDVSAEKAFYKNPTLILDKALNKLIEKNFNLIKNIYRKKFLQSASIILKNWMLAL
jgi:hypothetical protein